MSLEHAPPRTDGGPDPAEDPWKDPRRWAPWALGGLAVLLLGLFESDRTGVVDRGPVVVALLGMSLAVGVARTLPGAALALLWAVGAFHVLLGVPVLAAEVVAAVVMFCCARWGSRAVVVLSGLSVPAAALVAVAVSAFSQLYPLLGLEQARQLSDLAFRFSDDFRLGAALAGLFVLGAPWLAGLTLRATARAARSEESEERAQVDAAKAQVEASQAQEIARLQEGQARLARDVHDVVGHSLAVILAQAESGQYLPDDPAALKGTLATIATSARESLRDVRQVLSATEAPAPARPGGLEELVAGVRAAGQPVELDELGTARPLPPELEVVAYRVVQEMLTNAVKHGRRDRTVRVERHWPQDAFERDLRIEVSNAVAVTPGPTPALDETQPLAAVGAHPTAQVPTLDEPAEADGQGLDGMRRRVEAVGGRLDVRRRTTPDGPTFTTTAWLPVRA